MRVAVGKQEQTLHKNKTPSCSKNTQQPKIKINNDDEEKKLKSVQSFCTCTCCGVLCVLFFSFRSNSVRLTVFLCCTFPFFIDASCTKHAESEAVRKGRQSAHNM
jgi:hypothetical protein